MSTPAIQHSVNAVVAAAPAATIWAHAPEAVTTAVGVMAFLYYLLFFVEKILTWRRTWRKAKSETVTPIEGP